MIRLTSSLLLALMLVAPAEARVFAQNLNPQEAVPAGFTARPVFASASQSVVFFSTNSDYVETARQRLLSQCSGDITGISTQFAVTPKFLHYINEVRMEGLCIEPDVAAVSE
ncbi:hypothetical protein ACQUQU_01090 [Thalassolituus sp. LLYu03]|uniref:hypothetical protein n=1 Tax=Thalassolituus sp. LLYu03 TaxID=3421656 RepID=UPI003D2DAAD7